MVEKECYKQNWQGFGGLRFPYYFLRIQAFYKNKLFSDHFPIIVVISNIRLGPALFRSLDCQLEESSFLDTFKKESIQLTGESLEKKLKELKKPLQKQNREVLGHIDMKIKSFEEELEKLDSSAQNRELLEYECHRREELETQLWLWMATKERY